MRRNISRSKQKRRWPCPRFLRKPSVRAGTLRPKAAIAAPSPPMALFHQLSGFHQLCTHEMSVGVMKKERCLMCPLLVHQLSGFHQLCTHEMSVGVMKKERCLMRPLLVHQLSGFHHLCTHEMSVEMMKKERCLMRPPPVHQLSGFRHLCTHEMSVEMMKKERCLMRPRLSPMEFEKKVVRGADGQSAAGLCGHVGNFARSCPYVHKTGQAWGQPWQLPGDTSAELSWVVRGKSIGLVPSTLHRCMHGWIRSRAAAPRFIHRTYLDKWRGSGLSR